MTPGEDEHTFTVTAEGMCIDYQVPLAMSDGAVLRAEVFRPCEDARHLPLVDTCDTPSRPRR